jgi:glyoxylase-like metal-dependent hydrolase (beta-lactamase superfamily II)
MLRPFLNGSGSSASFVFGRTSHSRLAVVGPHQDLVESYLEAAERAGSPIVAVFETHVQADHVSCVVLPNHYGGSVCGRGLSGNPLSSIGFERAHNTMPQYGDSATVAEVLVADAPPPPTRQAEIVAANRRGAVPTTA